MPLRAVLVERAVKLLEDHSNACTFWSGPSPLCAIEPIDTGAVRGAFVLKVLAYLRQA